MNVGKYYVAGIPFDSENSLKHYGVKGMEWNKHKFGIDADDRYIKWLKNAGQNIGRFGANVAQNVAKGVTNAARTAGTAVNKGANFVTGNQNRQQYQNQSAAARTMRNPQQAQQRATNYYNQQQAKTLPGIAKTTVNTAKNTLSSTAQGVKNFAGQTAQNAGKALQNVADTAGKAINGVVDNAIRNGGAAAQNVGNTVGQAAQNVGNAVGNFFSNRDEYQRLDDLSKHYDPNTGKWDSEENRKAFYDAQDAYNRHPATAIPDMARQIGTDIANSPVVDFARDVGAMAGEVGNNIKNFVDNKVTGAGQQRFANMYNEWDQQNRADAAEGKPHYDVDAYSRQMQNAANEAREDAKNNTLFGRVGNAANAVGQAAQNVGNAVSGAANKATEGAKGFLNSAGQWVSGAANNVKNTASKAASDAKKGASGFLNSAGQWVSNAAGNVKNAAQNVGNTVGQAAQNVGNTVGQAAQNVGNTVGQAAQNVGNTVGQAAEQARGGIGGFFDRVGNAVGGAAQNVGNAVSGAANAVGDWAGNAAQNVGGAVQNASNWVGDQARNVGGAVTGAAQNVGEFVTGRNANENLERLYAENIANGGNGMSPELAEARAQYNRTLPGMAEWARDNLRENVGYEVEDAARNAGNWIGDQAKNVGQAVSGAAGNVADWARNAAGNVGNAVSGAAGNVADLARNAAGNVGNWAGQAAQNAGQSVANIPQNIANWYTGQPNADRAEAIDRQVQEYERMGDMMYRQGLQAQGDRYHQLAANLGSVADANQARYDAAPQQRLSTAGQWVGNQAQNVADWWNRRNPFVQHSALDDKPDGVSDAFWEKFTADGGTREDYERDWR